MQLGKWQRNAIFREIEKGGLDPRECEFTEGSDTQPMRIVHAPSGSYLTLDDEWGATRLSAHAQRFFGKWQIEGKLWDHPFEGTEWSIVEAQIWEWAKEVRRDAETPDLWADLKREREVLASADQDGVENTAFTPDELSSIEKHFHAIKESAQEKYSLTAEQMRSLEERLDQLQAAAASAGRRDWGLMVRGAIFTLIIEAVLPPEAVRQIFVTALRALGHLFGGGAETPYLPGDLPVIEQ